MSDSDNDSSGSVEWIGAMVEEGGDMEPASDSDSDDDDKLERISVSRRSNATLDQQLYEAVRVSSDHLVIQYIQEGANVNYTQDGRQGKSHIHEACRRGNLKIIRTLLDAGANVNLKIRNRIEYPIEKVTPFAYARTREIKNYLLIRGAYLDEEVWFNDIYNLLDSRKRQGKDTSISELIQIALDINVKTLFNKIAILILRGTNILKGEDSLKLLHSVINDCDVLNMDTKQILASNGNIIPKALINLFYFAFWILQ